MTTMRIYILVVATSASACTLLGDGPSAYETATLAAEEVTGLADGETPVVVNVSGDPNVQLTLVVAGSGASFRNADTGTPQEKSVVLSASGQASLEVVATQGGTVLVGFKPEPISRSLELDFSPVRIAAGDPVAVEFAAGAIVHDVCVATNASKGAFGAAIETDTSGTDTGGDDGSDDGGDDGNSGVLARELAASASNQAEIGTDPPAGLDCPTAIPGGAPIAGYARLKWAAHAASELVNVGYYNAAGTGIRNNELILSGEEFPGFAISIEDSVYADTYVSVLLHLEYLDSDTLSGGPAEAVVLTQRFIPEGEPPTFIGSSAGGAEEPIVTNANGDVTLFFDALTSGTWAWFVRPFGSEDYQLADLEIY